VLVKVPVDPVPFFLAVLVLDLLPVSELLCPESLEKIVLELLLLEVLPCPEQTLDPLLVFLPSPEQTLDPFLSALLCSLP
jgi:hypothetical protein